MSEPGPGAASGGSSIGYREVLRSFARYTTSERGPVGTALAIPAAGDPADRNLEQVGAILRRLDLDREAILALRYETRAILAKLAA
ncbi:MAG TPA: hypothetical protein VF142_14315 [Longimicrobium sp.]